MRIFKNTIFTILAITFLCVFTDLFLNAWDNTMSDDEIEYYLDKYPNEEKLIRLAERRNLNRDR